MGRWIAQKASLPPEADRAALPHSEPCEPELVNALPVVMAVADAPAIPDIQALFFSRNFNRFFQFKSTPPPP